MKLANVGRRFDGLQFVDALAVDAAFAGKLTPFADVQRDNVTGERRVLSVAPGVTIPASSVVTAEGVTWLVGSPQDEHFQGRLIRTKFTVQRADEVTAVKTLSEAIAGSAGTLAYATRLWVKALNEPEFSSLQLGVYDLYFSSAQSVAEGMLVQMGGRWHLIRSLYPSAAGFLCAIGDELEDPVVVEITLDSGAYDPVNDTRSAAPVTFNVIKLRWQSYFRYPTRASFTFERGDDVVVMRKEDATPKAGQSLTMLGSTWNIAAVLDETTHWSCHVRHA